MPPARASLASLVKRCAPAISPISLPAVSGPEAGLGEQLRRDLGDELGDLGLERVDGARELAQVAQLVAGDPDARGLLGACQAPSDPGRPLLGEQGAARERLLGPEVVQVPEQVVVERDRHADEPFAVIDQQPDVELDAGQLADRQRVQAFAQRGAGDGDRVDAVGLAALAAAAARAGHQPRRDPDHALATDEQKPLERARDVPAVLQRPDPLAAQAASPVQRPRRSRARRPRRSCRRAARRLPRRPRRSCASACACPHRARS